MSFKAVQVPERRPFCSRLAEGQTSIARTGVALFHLADLVLVSIGDEVALLADNGTLRVALRRLRMPEDSGAIVRVVPLKRRGKPVRGRVSVDLAPALRELGLTLAAVAGRYMVGVKSDLLVVDLGQARAGAEGKRG